MESLRKAFADKYQREDRQSYFGGITTDENIALWALIRDAKHYKLTNKDSDFVNEHRVMRTNKTFGLKSL